MHGLYTCRVDALTPIDARVSNTRTHVRAPLSCVHARRPSTAARGMPLRSSAWTTWSGSWWRPSRVRKIVGGGRRSRPHTSHMTDHPHPLSPPFAYPCRLERDGGLHHGRGGPLPLPLRLHARRRFFGEDAPRLLYVGRLTRSKQTDLSFFFFLVGSHANVYHTYCTTEMRVHPSRRCRAHTLTCTSQPPPQARTTAPSSPWAWRGTWWRSGRRTPTTASWSLATPWVGRRAHVWCGVCTCTHIHTYIHT